ncbi:hypothetical protein UR09_03840 [Candidatus Nitromaritima sp. SCGC AAA799-A02]|nr:hypothetical protein UZ36_06095 [Candidatus Nitromaritima sp. SCGC AAA799-C22]KMP11245.1 hypothetical protein UR09_03840 [Candidatus Nitromaritima sp. SCGC AAA799-A02]
MVLEGLTPNLLRLLSGEGLSDLPSGLIKFLKPGMLLQGTILKSLPAEGKAVIQLENKQIVVETPKPLTPGQTLTARVEKVSPHPVLKLIPNEGSKETLLPRALDTASGSQKQIPEIITRLSSGKAPVPQQLNSSELKILNLSPGQTIRAPVIKIASESTAVIRVAGKEVAVHFQEIPPPRPGAVVEAVVQAVHQKQDGSYRLTAGKESVASRPVALENIKPLLPFKQPLGEMIRKLDTLVSSTSLLKTINPKSDPVGRLIKTLEILQPQTNQVPDATRIKEQVNLSGINYEAKVRQVFAGKASAPNIAELGGDLKGQLLELAKTLQAKSDAEEIPPVQRRQIMELAQTFRRAADNVELQQLTNQFARQENQPVVLQIPNPFAHGEKAVKLYIRSATDEKKGEHDKEKKGVLLVFLLNLSALGDLRIDARMHQERVAVKISVENETVAHFIDGNLEGFRMRLDDLGFQGEASCCVQNKIELEFEHEMNQLLVEGNSRLVDLTT